MAKGIAEQLSELERLRSNQTISDDQFTALKDKLIAEALGTQPSVAAEVPKRQTSEPAPEPKPHAVVRFMLRVETVLLVACLIGGAGFFLYPMVMEGVSGPCAAVESKFYRQFLGSDGAETAVLVKSYYKDLPPALSCSLIYYDQLNAPGY